MCKTTVILTKRILGNNDLKLCSSPIVHDVNHVLIFDYCMKLYVFCSREPRINNLTKLTLLQGNLTYKYMKCDSMRNFLIYSVFLHYSVFWLFFFYFFIIFLFVIYLVIHFIYLFILFYFLNILLLIIFSFFKLV